MEEFVGSVLVVSYPYYRDVEIRHIYTHKTVFSFIFTMLLRNVYYIWFLYQTNINKWAVKEGDTLGSKELYELRDLLGCTTLQK